MKKVEFPLPPDGEQPTLTYVAYSELVIKDSQRNIDLKKNELIEKISIEYSRVQTGNLKGKAIIKFF